MPDFYASTMLSLIMRAVLVSVAWQLGWIKKHLANWNKLIFVGVLCSRLTCMLLGCVEKILLQAGWAPYIRLEVQKEKRVEAQFQSCFLSPWSNTLTKQLKREMVYLDHSSRLQLITAGKSRQQALGAIGHIPSLVRSREQCIRAHSILSLLLYSSEWT